ALIRDPKLVVAITPTRGVDVASKELLLGALRAAAERGAGVLLATDDLDDIEHCDRVVVLVRGAVAAEFQRAQGPRPFDREALIAATEGLDAQQAAAAQPDGGGAGTAAAAPPHEPPERLNPARLDEATARPREGSDRKDDGA